MLKYIHKHFEVWWLQAFFTFFYTGFVQLLYFFFFKEQISFSRILFADGIGLFVAALFLLRFGSFRAPSSIRWGFVLIICSLFSFFLPFSLSILLPLYFTLSILGIVLFYTTYNILFFRKSKKNHYLKSVTTYWSVAIIAAAFGPLLGGFLFERTPFVFFLSCGMLLMLGALYVSGCLKTESFHYEAREILCYLKGLRTLNMLDGALHKTVMITIGIFSLRYIDSASDFGFFLSGIGLVTLLVSFKIARVSDSLKKRSLFIWPLSVLAAFLVFSFYFVDSLTQYFVLAALFRSITILLEPLRTNVTQDKKGHGAVVWISRELYLTLGRAIFLFMSAFLLYLGFEEELFILFSFMYLLFPIFVYIKKIYVTSC